MGFLVYSKIVVALGGGEIIHRLIDIEQAITMLVIQCMK